MADDKSTRSLDGASKVFRIGCEICEKNMACFKIPKNETADSEAVCVCSECFQDVKVLEENLLGFYFNGARCVSPCSDCEDNDALRKKGYYEKCPTHYDVYKGFECGSYCECCPIVNSMVKQILENSSCTVCHIKKIDNLEKYDFLIEGKLLCFQCAINS
jgi:hypothetical protein